MEMVVQCICGGSKMWPAAVSAAVGAQLNKVEEHADPPFETQLQPQKASGFLCYSASCDQPLRGEAIREARLWYLVSDEQAEAVSFSLFINGFRFSVDGEEHSVSLSPFSLVRNCKFSCGTFVKFASLKIFKISLFTQGPCYYFGLSVDELGDSEAEEERSRWILDISHAMRLVTQSLFPSFRIRCDPLPHCPTTFNRLMAGYLVHAHDEHTIAVLYCELHAHHGEKAQIILYENELCLTPVTTIVLTDCTVSVEKVGINCSCFVIEGHDFASRTMTERKLWLRAVSNVKVKLQNLAPNPSQEQLTHFRSAINEHLETVRSTFEEPVDCDPLLLRCPRRCTSRAPVCTSDVVLSDSSNNAALWSLDQEVAAVSANSTRCALKGIDAPTRSE
mmetsp:Transcript_124834/g.286029  ORF Transcript_124834/g.286029 Transcript_124834/m.286029 type:complete len:391 (+) Transcript_124834:66-1238(+)